MRSFCLGSQGDCSLLGCMLVLTDSFAAERTKCQHYRSITKGVLIRHYVTNNLTKTKPTKQTMTANKLQQHKMLVCFLTSRCSSESAGSALCSAGVRTAGGERFGHRGCWGVTGVTCPAKGELQSWSLREGLKWGQPLQNNKNQQL